MPTKEQILKQLDDSQKQNKKLLLTLIEIKTSPSWDAKSIRQHIGSMIAEIVTDDTMIEKPKRIRKQKELEPA